MSPPDEEAIRGVWSPSDAAARGSRLLLGLLASAALAVLALAANAPLYNLGQLHVKFAYVDQAGYIVAARVLADTGELRSGVVFPSLLDAPDAYVHMPGHVATLAASYALFGWGVAQTLLPSVLAYVLATAGCFALANRLYGARAGCVAAALFALFPANVTYAFTAMAELTFACAAVAALVAFVHVPRRLLPFAPPVLLVLPFLFRETGAFLVLPMAVCVWRVRGLLPAALSVAGSVLSLWLVQRWQIASGKLAASLAFVTQGGFNYGDAFAGPPPELSAGEWLAALGANLRANLEQLADHARELPGGLMPLALLGLLAGAAFVAVSGLRRRRDDPFAAGAGALMVFVALLAVTVYDAKAHKLLRTLMFTWPLGAVALGGRIGAGPGSGVPWRGLGNGALAAVLALVALGSGGVSYLAAREMTAQDDLSRTNLEQLLALHPRGTIVAENVAAPLAVTGYPDVRWCLTPSNERTLELVLERLRPTTLVLFAPPSAELLARHGFRLAHEQRIGRVRHYFYLRAP